MIGLVLFLGSLGALVSSFPNSVVYDIDRANDYFEEFIRTYDKHYADEQEKQTRFKIFQRNLEEYNVKNKRNEGVYGITQFTDLTLEEFLSKYSCLLPDYTSQCLRMNITRSIAAPDALDWRTQQKVTKVKNQNPCGSCWAFAAIGNIESQNAIASNQLISLSEQQLLDCDSRGSCKGGLVSSAIMTAASQGGVMDEQDYPYIKVKSSCRFDANRVRVRVTGCNMLTPRSEENLKGILAQQGPISFGLDGTRLNSYDGGIIRNCVAGRLNHAVLLVGYGTEGGIPYWIVKNSYGPTWGEQGFFRLEMNKNSCNMMASQFVTATVR